MGSRSQISGEEKSCDELLSRDGQAAMIGRIIRHALEEGCLVCSREPLTFCVSINVSLLILLLFPIVLLMLLLLLSYNLLLLSNCPSVCSPCYCPRSEVFLAKALRHRDKSQPTLVIRHKASPGPGPIASAPSDLVDLPCSHTYSLIIVAPHSNT